MVTKARSGTGTSCDAAGMTAKGFSSGVAVSLLGAITQGEYYDGSDEQDQGYRQDGPPQLGDAGLPLTPATFGGSL